MDGFTHLNILIFVHKNLDRSSENTEQLPTRKPVEKLPFDSHLFLPAAYVIRREGYVLTHVCPAVCPHLGGRGVPRPGPDRGGTPARSDGGGYPGQVQVGGALARSGGYPSQGVPHLWPPPCQSDMAGGGGVPHLG